MCALYFKVRSIIDSVSEGTCDIFFRKFSIILIVDRRFQRNLKSFFGQKFYYPRIKHNYYLGWVWEYRFMGKVCHHTSQLSIDLSECIYSTQENFDLKKF